MAKWVYIGVIIAAVFVLSAIPALAQEEAALRGSLEESYICGVIGCRDPFVSLIRPNPDEGIDISQVNVVAIIWDAEGRYALMSFPDGKYYMFKEGMSIGLHDGKIQKIAQDSVMVREMKTDPKGQMKPVDTYLKLRKEGK